MAFGIPMIHTILEWKNSTKKAAGDDAEPAAAVESLYLPSVDRPTETEDQDVKDSEDEEDQEEVDQIQDEAEDKDDNEQLGCVKLTENARFDFKEKLSDSENQPLLGLVLTPTRELAVQVKHHIDAATKFTGTSL